MAGIPLSAIPLASDSDDEKHIKRALNESKYMREEKKRGNTSARVYSESSLAHWYKNNTSNYNKDG